MFSDGIRPGGDLTELDGSPEHRRSSRRSSARGHKKNRARHQHVSHGPVAGSSVAKSLIPPEGLPFVTGHGPVEPFELVQRFRCDETVSFSVNRNLRVGVKLVHCKKHVSYHVYLCDHYLSCCRHSSFGVCVEFQNRGHECSGSRRDCDFVSQKSR